MKRLQLKCVDARVIDLQMTQWAERRDDKGKMLAEARDRRLWNKHADTFVDAAGEYDRQAVALIEAGAAFTTSCAHEQATMAEDILAELKDGGTDAKGAVEGIKSLFEMRLIARGREDNATIQAIGDDSALGMAACEVIVDEAVVKLVSTTFESLDLPNDRNSRRIFNRIISALAKGLTDEAEYVPDKPRLLEKAG